MIWRLKLNTFNKFLDGKSWTDYSGFLKKLKKSKRILFSKPELLVGILLTLFIILGAIFAPIIAKVDPLKMDYTHILKPPLTSGYLLGTDQFGRDMISRLLYGARISLLIAWSSVFGAAILGSIIGPIAGYYGGFLDNVMMRIIEAIMTFPLIIIALLLATVFIPGAKTLILVFIIVGSPVFAKITRGVVLSLKEQEFVLAAKALGGTNMSIIFKHIFPNIIHQILVLATLQISRVMFVEAGLSFIGVGVQPPYPSWGNMLADGRSYMMVAWWLPILPGLALLITVLGANLLCDGLQEILDPKRRKIVG